MTTIFNRCLRLALVVAGAILPSVCHAAPAFPWRWQSVQPFTSLTAAGRLGDAYLVVGADGLIGTIRGGTLSIETSPFRARFQCVWVAPSGRAFIGADGGIVLSRSPTGELSILPASDGICRGCSGTQIVGKSETDFYTVGPNGIAHFTGHSWEKVDGLGKDNYSASLVSAGSSFYAVADETVWKLIGSAAQEVHELKGFQSFWADRQGLAFGIRDRRLHRFDGKRAVDLKLEVPWNSKFLANALVPLLLSDNQVSKVVANRVVPLGPRDGTEPLVAAIPENQGARVLTQSGIELLLERGTVKQLRTSALSAGSWGLEHRIGGPFPDKCAEKAQRRQEVVVPSRAGITIVSRLSRAGLTYAITNSPKGTAVEQYDGQKWSTLLEPSDIAQWQSAPLCIGGIDDGKDELWVAAGTFAVLLSGKYYKRYSLGWSGGHNFFSVGRDLFLYGESASLHWDGYRWNREPTFAQSITAFCEQSGNAYLVDTRNGYRQLRVRRKAGYFAGATSDGSLAASLAGDEFGVVHGAAGSRLAAFIGTRSDASDEGIAPGQVAFHGSHGWSWLTTDSGLGIGSIAARGKSFIGAGADGFLYRGVVSQEGNVTLTRDVRLAATAIDFTSPSEARIATSTAILKWDGNKFTTEFELGAAARPSHGWSDLNIRTFGTYRDKTYAFGANGETLVLGTHGHWEHANLDDPVTGFRKLGGVPSRNTFDEYGEFSGAQSFEPCAALAPTRDTLALVSCDSGWVAVLKGDHWHAYPVPVQSPLLSATCIEDDACYLFAKMGAFRANPADL